MKKVGVSVRASVAALAVLCSAGLATAKVVIQDGFTNGGVEGNDLAGNHPDTTNLPGGTYIEINPGDSPTGTTVYTGSADTTDGVQLQYSGGDYLPLATGSYTVSTPLTISANIEVGTTYGTVGGPYGQRGVGLGFTATDPTQTNPGRAINGVTIDQDGDIGITNGADFTASDSWNTASAGAFNPDTYYPVSFAYNPTTGVISDVEVDNVGYSFSSSTVNAVSSYVGFYASSADFSTNGYLTDLVVSDTTAVPEPTSLGLLAVASMGLLARRR